MFEILSIGGSIVAVLVSLVACFLAYKMGYRIGNSEIKIMSKDGDIKLRGYSAKEVSDLLKTISAKQEN